MAMHIKPRYAQHDQIVTLRLEPKTMSWSSMDMRIYDHHRNEQLFASDGKTGSFHRQVQLLSTDAEGQSQQPLYTLKQKRFQWDKIFYALDDEIGEGEDSEMPVFQARSIVSSFGREKNDLEIDFIEKAGMPTQKLWLIKTDQHGISQILNQDKKAIARIMRDKSGLLQTRSSPRDVVIVDVMPGVDTTLVLLCMLSLHVLLVVRRRQRGGAAGGGGGALALS